MEIPVNIERHVKKRIKAKEHQFFAVCQPGFEEQALNEIKAVGITNILAQEVGGIEFKAKIEDCWRLNLTARTLSKVLMRVTVFRADNFARFYKKMNEVEWEILFCQNASLKFRINCEHSKLYHTGRLESDAKKAIATRFQENNGAFINEQDRLKQEVVIRFKDDLCTVSLNTSGESLYKRGYKEFVCDAPLRENVAAAILQAANLENYQVLLDPMSGSGTFSLEAAWQSLGCVSNKDHEFSFMQWPSFREAAFKHLIKEEKKLVQEKNFPLQIFASDLDAKAEKNVSHNAGLAGVADLINFQQKDFFELKANFPEQKTLLVLNPPYGQRLITQQEAYKLYQRLGQEIKKFYADCSYAIIVPQGKFLQALNLPFSKKIEFRNGGLKVIAIFK